MAKSIFKKKNITGATVSNGTTSQSDFSNTSQSSFSKNTQNSNGRSWTTSKVSGKTKKQLKNAEKKFSSPYANQLNSAVSDIANRKAFSYDLNEDSLYKQYAENYKNLGNQAMQDTMANASTLSSGYGNSYATTAGQQAYNSYLQQLNDIVPTLYQQARSNYDTETSNQYNKASLLQGLDSEAYQRYSNNRSYYADKYNNEWNRNAVTHSKQTDTSTQIQNSSSSTSSHSTNTSNNVSTSYQKKTTPVPTYEELKDASKSSARVTDLLNHYGIKRATTPLTQTEWENTKDGQDDNGKKKGKAAYRRYLAEYLDTAVSSAYGKSEDKNKNKKNKKNK